MQLELIFILIFLAVGYSILHKPLMNYLKNKDKDDEDLEEDYSSDDSDSQTLNQINNEMGVSRRVITRQKRRERKEEKRQQRRNENRAYTRRQKMKERKEKEYERKQNQRKRKEEEEKKKKNEESQKEFENWAHLFETVQSGKKERREELNVSDFVDLIKKEKIVNLETLSLKFSISTISSVVERIETLQNNGLLSGIFDDRGKYIYISRKEMDEISAVVKEKGRVTSEEIQEITNDVINKYFHVDHK